MNPEQFGRVRRVVVLGGAGYVGTVLMPHLLGHGFAVTCADLLLYENGPLVLPLWDCRGFRFLRADLRDSSTYDAILDGATDVVILAALVGDPITKKYPGPSKEINVEAVRNFLSAAQGRGLKRVVFVSTCSNYGLQKDHALATEASPLNPLSVYAHNKVEIEQFLTSGAVDLPFTILRFATAFGLSPRMRFDLTVSEFTREMYLGRELLVFDPDTWRPYCHVKDLARAIGAVLEAADKSVNGQVFNTGGDRNNHTKRSIVEIISKKLPGAKVVYKEHGTDPRNYRVDFAKIRQTLDFEPEYTVDEGVQELLRALESGIFAGVDAQPNFYGNRCIPMLERKNA